jgi:chloramphenicol-sensitive protein RarD
VSETRRGFWYGFGAYFLWGIFPLYFPLLEPTGALEVLAHRIVWSLVFVGVLLLMGAGGPACEPSSPTAAGCAWWPSARSDRRQLGRLHLGGAQRHVLESSLGYFINPLVLIFLGVVVLGERLRRSSGSRSRWPRWPSWCSPSTTGDRRGSRSRWRSRSAPTA